MKLPTTGIAHADVVVSISTTTFAMFDRRVSQRQRAVLRAFKATEHHLLFGYLASIKMFIPCLSLAKVMKNHTKVKVCSKPFKTSSNNFSCIESGFVSVNL